VQTSATAVAGADAVVSALGPSLDRKATGLPLVQGTAHILESMKRHGVVRYIGHGTPSVLDPREKPTWQTRLVRSMGRTMLPPAHNELLDMTELSMNAGVKWTIVRFTAPKDTPKTGKLRVGFYGTNRFGFAVSRADIAAFAAPGRRRHLRRRRTSHQQLTHPVPRCRSARSPRCGHER
jgi:NAD(P)H-binding